MRNMLLFFPFMGSGSGFSLKRKFFFFCFSLLVFLLSGGWVKGSLPPCRGFFFLFMNGVEWSLAFFLIAAGRAFVFPFSLDEIFPINKNVHFFPFFPIWKSSFFSLQAPSPQPGSLSPFFPLIHSIRTPLPPRPQK